MTPRAKPHLSPIAGVWACVGLTHPVTPGMPKPQRVGRLGATPWAAYRTWQLACEDRLASLGFIKVTR